MNNKIMKAFLIFVVSLSVVSCKKLPDGFLSDYVRYEEDPIVISKGRTKVSTALNWDGSTKPGDVKLLHIYDMATGKLVDDIFNKTSKVTLWTAAYDAATDTTIELINAKQKEAEITPVSINPISGQVEANYTTLALPSGMYEFDLQITNGAGSKTYPKIGRIQLVEAPPFEKLAAPYMRMIQVGNESSGTTISSGVDVSVTRTADAPNKVILKYVDKNGVAFNPANGEIIRRPNTGNNPIPPFLQTLQDYALKTELFNDRMEFTYGVTPFPLTSKGNGYNIYYRIPSQFFSHDNQTSFPDGKYSANPRFEVRFYVPGTYNIIFKTNFLTKR